MAKPMPKPMIMPREFLRMCRRRRRSPKIADTTGVVMTGGSLLYANADLSAAAIAQVLGPDEKFVGLLVPPSAGGVLANIAVPLCGRVPVNLNYTVSSEVMNSCIRQAEIKHVLTSRKVIERFNLEIDAELVYPRRLQGQGDDDRTSSSRPFRRTSAHCGSSSGFWASTRSRTTIC